MTSSPETWKTESLIGRQTAAAMGMTVVGLVLVVWLRHVEGQGFSDARAGFWLGVLLLVVGAGALVAGGKQVITVEPRSRRIVIEQTALLGARRTVVEFSQIADVELAELGDKEGGSISYYLAVKLKSGKEMSLFLGFFEGSCSRAAMEARREKLLGYLRTDGQYLSS
jgi:hypothetical protein